MNRRWCSGRGLELVGFWFKWRKSACGKSEFVLVGLPWFSECYRLLAGSNFVLRCEIKKLWEKVFSDWLRAYSIVVAVCCHCWCLCGAKVLSCVGAGIVCDCDIIFAEINLWDVDSIAVQQLISTCGKNIFARWKAFAYNLWITFDRKNFYLWDGPVYQKQIHF